MCRRYSTIWYTISQYCAYKYMYAYATATTWYFPFPWVSSITYIRVYKIIYLYLSLSILFYSLLCYAILFYAMLCYSILCYSIFYFLFSIFYFPFYCYIIFYYRISLKKHRCIYVHTKFLRIIHLYICSPHMRNIKLYIWNYIYNQKKTIYI